MVSRSERPGVKRFPGAAAAGNPFKVRARRLLITGPVFAALPNRAPRWGFRFPRRGTGTPRRPR